MKNLVRLSKRFVDHRTIDRHLAESTVLGLITDLTDFNQWLCRRKATKTVTTATLRAYLAYTVRQRGLGPATLRRRYFTLRSFFRYLAKRGVVAVDPFIGWEVKLPRPERLPRTLTRDEAIDLLKPGKREIASRSRTGATYLTEMHLMIATGIRVGELCQIKVRDFKSDASSLLIRGKGSRERIVYVMNRKLCADLKKLIASRKESHGAFGPLFLNQFGRRLRPDSVRHQLNRFAKIQGISRRITPHMLRHTAATLLLESGTDIRFVQRLLGHSTLATTEMYTNVSDAALRSMLKRADILGTLTRSQMNRRAVGSTGAWYPPSRSIYAGMLRRR